MRPYPYISVNYSALTGYPYAVVNAVQIKAGDPASVPEPSTVALIGAGIILAVEASKKNKSTSPPPT
ncbi:MAG: PEP-CTERM sorting domain-containing protein [Chlorobaculum sp.]|nr:PEP-CTERM sorting domain-containing protein [Chlorobaculum sp.]